MSSPFVPIYYGTVNWPLLFWLFFVFEPEIILDWSSLFGSMSEVFKEICRDDEDIIGGDVMHD
jgi:hypothetical protein